MKQLDTYIIEKLKIDKNTKISSNKELVSKIKKYLLEHFTVNYKTNKKPFQLYKENDINIIDSGKYILLTLRHDRELYKSIMNYINTNFKDLLQKDCKTNHQSIYIYPKQ